MAEYDGELDFVFTKQMPDKLSGLLHDHTVYINSNQTKEKMIATIAEEIGHYETMIDHDITDYSNLNNWKEERKGRIWSYHKIIPSDELEEFVSDKEQVYNYEIAEQFEVPADIVEEAVLVYRVKGML